MRVVTGSLVLVWHVEKCVNLLPFSLLEVDNFQYCLGYYATLVWHLD